MILKEYNIKKPHIIEFIDLCRGRGIHLNNTNDIRDLIKEVYKNV